MRQIIYFVYRRSRYKQHISHTWGRHTVYTHTHTHTHTHTRIHMLTDWHINYSCTIISSTHTQTLWGRLKWDQVYTGTHTHTHTHTHTPSHIRLCPCVLYLSSTRTPNFQPGNVSKGGISAKKYIGQLVLHRHKAKLLYSSLLIWDVPLLWPTFNTYIWHQ